MKPRNQEIRKLKRELKKKTSEELQELLDKNRETERRLRQELKFKRVLLFKAGHQSKLLEDVLKEKEEAH